MSSILHDNTDLLNQIRAAMLGFAIADAMGVPVEFNMRSKLKQNPVTDYRGYGSHNMPAGTWSDDTSMALASMDSLSRGLDYDDMMRRFCNWTQSAAYTASDRVFDIGIATNAALYRYKIGTPALDCGGSGERDNGNGSLMRIIPAVLYVSYCMPAAGDDDRMDVIHKASQLTHAHPHSKMACGIFAFVMIELLVHGSRSAVLRGIERAQEYYAAKADFRTEMQHFQRFFNMRESLPSEDDIQSSGYVVSTLEAAVWCLLTTENYSDCILRAVNLGDDTDTVAAVAGGLAGVMYGMEGIPDKWYEGLIRKEMIEELCAAFADAIPARNGTGVNTL